MPTDLFCAPRPARCPAPTGPPTRLQILGERCSGTNFVAELLRRNLGLALTEEIGFKHWFVSEGRAVPADVLVIGVERDAADWVRSLHRQPWHAHPSLRALSVDEFARAEWHCVWDDARFGIGPDHRLWGTEMMHERDPATGERFADPLAMRHAKHGNWGRLIARAPHGAWLRYEEVRARPREAVERIARACAVPVREAFDPVTTYKGQAGRPFSPRRYAPLDRETLAHVAQYA